MNLLLRPTHAFAALAFIFILAPSFANAQTPSVVAQVGIRNCSFAQEGSTASITCDFVNRGALQPDVHYSIQLIQGSGTDREILDDHVFPDTLVLAADSSVSKTITYTVPPYIGGTVEVWLIASNSEGLRLAQNQVGTITATVANGAVQILPGSCSVTIQDDPEGKIYTPQQGVDIAPSENLVGKCTVLNPGTTSITLTPQFETFQRNLFGELVDASTVSNAELTLAAGEKKDYTFAVPKPAQPQAYDSILTFTKGNEDVSNSARIHYVIQGQSATIQNIALDKPSYAKGDTAVITTSWSPSADSFYGSRSGGTAIDAARISASITTDSGRTCGMLNQALPKDVAAQYAPLTLSVPIDRDCIHPTVTVQILDTSGAVIVEKTVGTTETPSSTPMIGLIRIAIAIAMVLIIGIILYFFYTRFVKKNDQTPPSSGGSSLKAILPIFLILFSGALLVSPHAAHADSFMEYWDESGNGSHAWFTYFTADLSKTQYAPGETIEATVSFVTGYCTNGGGFGARMHTTNLADNDARDTSWYPSEEGVQKKLYFTAPSQPGTYRIRFTGKSEASTGPGATDEIVYTVSAPTPPSPTLYTPSCSADGNQVTLSWNPASGADRYYVRLNSNSGYEPIDDWSATSITRNVVPNQYYDWWVHSYNSSNPNNYSNPSYGSFRCIPPPPSPDYLSPSCNAAGNQVTFTWPAASGATDYALRMDNVSAGQRANNTDSTGGGRSITYNVNPGQTYNGWVHGINSSGWSAARYSGNFSCPPPRPAQPAYMNYSCNAAGNQVTMSWPTSANSSEYKARLANVDTNSQAYSSDSLGGATSIIYNISPGTRYQGWVHGYNPSYPGGYGDARYSDVFACRLPPPTGLTKNCAANGTSVTLNWNGVSGANNYYVRLRDNSNGGSVSSQDGVGGTSATYATIPGHSYSWWVHSNVGAADYNGNHYSDQANGADFSCAGTVDLTSGYVVPSDSSPIVGTSVRFDDAAFNSGSISSGGFPILYQIYENGALFNTGYISVPAGGGTSASANYTFNTPGTYNIRGCVNYNTSWQAITPETDYGNNCSGWTTITVRASIPAAPTGLTYSCNAAGTQATLSWNPTPGATFYYVRVNNNTCPSGWSQANATTCVPNPDYVTGTSITYGTNPNQSYSWVLYSANGTGYSAPTVASNNINCASQADLIPSIGNPITVTAGQPMTYTATTRNNGGSAAGSFYDKFIIYYANQSVYGYDTPAGSASLAPGATVSRTGGTTISTPGTYYYQLCSDWVNSVPESNEGNNCSALQTITVNPPAASPTSITPVCSANGTSVTLSWPAGANATSYYVRLDQQANNSASCSGGGWYCSQPPDYVTDNYGATSATYPVTPNQSYGAWVHGGNYAGIDNNPASTSFTCSGQPNLYSVTGPALSGVAGQPVTFSGTTYNNGNTTAPAGFYDLFRITDASGNWTYPNGTANGGNSWTYINPTYSGAIGAGGNAARSGTFTFNNPGTYYYSLCADWGGNVAESNEGDNCGATQSITITAPVPVTPTMNPAACSADGTSVTLSWNAPQYATSYAVRLDQWANNTASCQYGWYCSQPPDFITDNYTNNSITYPVTPNFTYGWWVHAGNSTGGSDATGVAFTCSAPDLIAGAVTPTSATTGSAATFSSAASNIGGAAAGGFPMLFQIASNPSNPAGSIIAQQNSAYVGGLAGNSSVTMSTSYTFPSAGTYAMRACANKNTSGTFITSESDYGNNCGAWTNIGVAPAPVPSLTCAPNPATGNPGDPITYTITPSGGATGPYHWQASGSGPSGNAAGTSFSTSFPTGGTWGMNVQAANMSTPGTCAPNVTMGPGVCTTGTPTLTITASPVRVRKGETTTITWSASNVQSGAACTVTSTQIPYSSGALASGGLPTCAIPDGSTTQTIQTQSVFTLKCGSATVSTIVNVVPNFTEF